MKHVCKILLAFVFLQAQSALAQDPVRGLQDLVGARGSSGEAALQSRGYNNVGGEKYDNASWTYWERGSSRDCIAVVTKDGRYQSISHARPTDCERVTRQSSVGSDGKGTAAGNGDRFDSVCGVMVDGEDYRYRCKVVDVNQDGRKVRTQLHYPDQKIVLIWKSVSRADVRFEGMKPQPVTVASSEGETNFGYEGKTYYYISNKEMAAFEVRNFKD